MRTPRTALLLVVAALFATGTALADDVQTTEPDACAVFTARMMRSVLGPGVRATPERFPLPERSASDPNLNHYLDVSHTSCTWANPASFPKSGVEAVNVQVYQRNDEYSGGEPWSVNEKVSVYARLGIASAINSVDPRWVARRFHFSTPPAGTPFFVLIDDKTDGKRRVWVGYQLDDGLWLDIGVAATKRSALSIAGPLIRRIVGG